jgi:sugar lactone lactonase YvrE
MRRLLSFGVAALALAGGLSLASCADILGIGNRVLEDGGPGGDAMKGDAGPTVLVMGLNEPFRVVADPKGENIYWSEQGSSTTDGSIGTYNLASGKLVRSFVAGLPDPTDIAIDDQSLYWINAFAGQIVSCELASGCKSTTILVKGTTALALAIDSAHLYWLTSAGELERVDKDGSHPSTLASPSPSGLQVPNSCFVDPSGSLLLGDPGFEDGGINTVWRVSNNGSGLRALQTSAGCPCYFASSPTNDYWTSVDTASVQGLAVGGSSPSSVLTAQNGPERLAYDPSSRLLYLANFGTGQAGSPDGTIVRFTTNGQTFSNIAANLEQPLDVAVAGQSVFFITGGPIQGGSTGLPFKPSSGTLVQIPK